MYVCATAEVHLVLNLLCLLSASCFLSRSPHTGRSGIRKRLQGKACGLQCACLGPGSHKSKQPLCPCTVTSSLQPWGCLRVQPDGHCWPATGLNSVNGESNKGGEWQGGWLLGTLTQQFPPRTWTPQLLSSGLLTCPCCLITLSVYSLQ